jgi:hypothetical protein
VRLESGVGRVNVELKRALAETASRNWPTKDAVSVRYANGEVKTRHRNIFGTSDPRPVPGSEVSVPAKDPNAPHTDYVALFGAIAQVLASTVAIIVVAAEL